MSKIDMQIFLNQYWEYFIVLENEFNDTEKYLTIDEDNYKSFSVEYAKLMQTICSEIDVLSKEYCRFLNEDYKADTIAKYAYIITENRNDILNQEVLLIKKKHLIFKPWENWQYTINTDKNGIERVNGTPPKWWTMYNKIKHERTTFSKSLNKHFFKFANQENVLNALSALFILEMYFYKDIVLEISDDYPLYPNERSKIFDMDKWDTAHIPASELMAFVTSD
jgi:hypothetical protein